MTVKAAVSGGGGGFNLSFNEIIGFNPGSGRGDARPGTYEHKNGKLVLVVYSKNPQLVEIEPRQNGKRTNRTGLTRTGMFMVGKAGKVRLVTCDREPDGEKNWRESSQTITIGGNPHVVPTPAEGDPHEAFDEDDSDEE